MFATDVITAAITVLTTPVLLSSLGTQRFGVLGLATVVASQVTLLQLGIGPAATRRIAQWRGEGSVGGEAAAIRAAVRLSLVAAVLGGGAAWLLGLMAWRNLFNASPPVVVEALRAVPALAAVVAAQPIVGGAFAALAGQERFAVVARLRASHGILRQVAGVAAVLVTDDVPIALLTFAIIDSVAGATGWYLAGRGLGYAAIVADGREITELLRLGLPTALTGMLALLLVDVEKIAVTVTQSIEAFVYYGTPYTALMRLTLLSSALAGVLMPRLAFLAATEEKDKAATMLRVATRACVAMMTAFALPLIGIMPELLTLWLGKTFAAQATLPARIILVGLVAQSGVFPAHALLRARAKPLLITGLYAAEVAVQVPLAFGMVWMAGTSGAAIAWTLRSFVDTFIQQAMARRVIGATLAEGSLLAMPSLVAALAVAASVAHQDALPWLVRLSVGASAGAFGFFWLLPFRTARGLAQSATR